MTASYAPSLPLLEASPEQTAAELLARFYRALGDPTRLRLLEFCAQQERTGAECVAQTTISQGRVSAHLACLVSCGLLGMRRQGRFKITPTQRKSALATMPCESIWNNAPSIPWALKVKMPMVTIAICATEE